MVETKRWSGVLRKLRVRLATPVQYWLADGAIDEEGRAEDLSLNDCLGAGISLRFEKQINCIACGRSIKKTFGQGFCYPCFRSRPEADTCLFKPELCHFHEPDNPCRDEEWGLKHCFQPHILYAAVTSGAKVGITRITNVPTRWIDQGALRALPLAELPDRRSVGLVEHRLTDSGVNDKTHWMKMLRAQEPEVNLEERAAELIERLEQWRVEGIFSEERRIPIDFEYPVDSLPTKIKSLDLNKVPSYEGHLRGIKGQYLIFDDFVFNVRKHTGFRVTFELF